MIALLSSKNQINNLRSYFDRFGHDYSELIVICFYENLIDESKTKLNPKRVIFIQISPFDNFLKIVKYLIYTIPTVFISDKTVIIGDTMSRYKHYLLYLLNPRKVIAIDDGIKSVYSFNEDLKFCLPKKYFDRLSFVYTNYNLNFKKVKSFINHYPKKKRHNVNNQIVWFIGQPLIVDRRSTPKELRTYFDFIEGYFKDKEIIYFRHPREIETYKYSKFKIAERSEISFEQHFEKSEYYPGSIISFYSTSIDYCIRSSFSNCGIDFYYFEIKVDQRVEAIYNYLKNNGVKKLN